MNRRKKKSSKGIFIFALLLILVLSLFVGVNYFNEKYTIKTVLVEGNIHYTEAEIKDIVLSGKHSDNSLILSRRYKNKEITDIPFIAAISVNIISDDTIRISVFEKSLAGYIEYLGRYIYFDKDGIVVESSNIKTEGIPEVIGLNVDYIVLYKELPVENKDIFKEVLKITQLMEKYSVSAEKMYFASNGDMVLFSKDVAVNLGKDENLDIKIMNLPSILEKLDGQKGTLRMENYDEETKRVSFEVSQ